jgi:hypothetical protein
MGIRPFDVGGTMISTILGALMLWALASVLFLAVAYGVSAKRRVCVERRTERILAGSLSESHDDHHRWRCLVVVEAKRIVRGLSSHGRADYWELAQVEARCAVLIAALGFEEHADAKTTSTVARGLREADILLGRPEIYRLTALTVVSDHTSTTAQQVASKVVRGG